MPRFGEIEPLPIIGDDQLQAFFDGSQGDLRLARARVRSDVAQRFLSDAVQTERNVVGNAVQTLGDRKGYLDRVLPTNFGTMTLERGGQAGVLQDSGVEFMRQVTDHVGQINCALLQQSQLVLNRPVPTVLQLPLDVAESDGQARELLVDIVVELACDARALGLLCRDQPSGQILNPLIACLKGGLVAPAALFSPLRSRRSWPTTVMTAERSAHGR